MAFNCRVLIVEDDPNLMLVMQTVLRRIVDGAAIATARNYAETVQVLNDCTPQFVILESTMPGMSASTLIHHILAQPKLDSTRIVLISLVPMRRASTGLSRIAEVLVKPIRPRELEYVLTRLLAAGIDRPSLTSHRTL